MFDHLNNPGSRTLARGYGGSWADTNIHFSTSRTNEGTTVIDFGVAVARGTSSTKCKRLAADGDKIIGISIRNPVIGPYNPTTGEVSYEAGKEVAIAEMGSLLVVAAENATEGDAVIAVVASGGALGSVTGGAAGTGRLAVPNARWAETVTAGNVGVIKFNLLGAV